MRTNLHCTFNYSVSKNLASLNLWTHYKRILQLPHHRRAYCPHHNEHTTHTHLTLGQWFSTFELKGAKSSPTTLLESRTKDILKQVNLHVLLCCRMKSVPQNIRGVSVTERLLRTAQRMLGSCMRLFKAMVENHCIRPVRCSLTTRHTKLRKTLKVGHKFNQWAMLFTTYVFEAKFPQHPCICFKKVSGP